MSQKISVFNEETGEKSPKESDKKLVFSGSKRTVKRTEAAWFEIVLRTGSP